MELDDNETVVHSDPVNAPSPSSKVTELDLYDELSAFAELSPEEQAQLIERLEVTSANASITSAAHSEQATDQQPDPIHASPGPVEQETTTSDTETPSAAEVEQDTSLEEPATDLTFEPVRTEQAAAEVDTSSTQEQEDTPLEQQTSYQAIEAAQPEPPHSVDEPTEDTSTYLAIETAQPEFHSGDVLHTPKIPVASATADGSESVPNSEGSDAPGEQDHVSPPEVIGPRPSGPLSGFNLPANIVYTGSLSRGLCLACGAAESGEDDLFCPACGAFMDELGLTAGVDSTCAECKQVIAADEIFCPWCGSALPA